MDENVEKALQFVGAYAPSIHEWRVLKKEVMKNLPPASRALFSTRDPVTKKQNFNDFERTVAERWREITGIELIFSRS